MSSTTGREESSQCPVCSYPAEGNHYGILSCRSCASFFKRVVEKGDTFNRHPAPVPGIPFNYCNIMENRNACKQCRYLKCIETGMQASAVQPKREPTGAQMNRKRKTLLQQNELSEDIQGLSVTTIEELTRSSSGSPTRKSSGSEFARTESRKSSESLSGRLVAEKEMDMHFFRKDVLEENNPFGRLMSFDSDEGSSNESRGLGGRSARSSLERGGLYEEQEDEDDAHPNLPTWLGHRVDCPVCPKGQCVAGLGLFYKLIDSFGDHTRQMQLSFTSIDDFIQEIAKGMILREMEPGDINKLSNVELAGLLFWVEKMGHLRDIPYEDQINLVKRYSVRKLSLDHFYSASKFKEHAKLRNFVLNNYTYVPADKTGFETPSEDIRQREAKFEIFKNTFERFWTNVIDRFISLRVGDAEIVFLHFLLMWSPLNKQFVSETTKALLASRRNWATQMIFEYFHEKGTPDPELRVGELINLYQEIEVIIDQHCADVHVAKLFDFCDLSDYWYDHACYSAINLDRPIDCALDVAKLLELFANLAHNMCESALEDRLPEVEPKRINYSDGREEPMPIIKWISKRVQAQKRPRDSEEELNISHSPTRMDIVIPSTKRGKPMYPSSFLQKADLDETLLLNTPSIHSADVSPEGMNADSPYGNDSSVVRRNCSEE